MIGRMAVWIREREGERLGMDQPTPLLIQHFIQLDSEKNYHPSFFSIFLINCCDCEQNFWANFPWKQTDHMCYFQKGVPLIKNHYETATILDRTRVHWLGFLFHFSILFLLFYVFLIDAFLIVKHRWFLVVMDKHQCANQYFGVFGVSR